MPKSIRIYRFMRTEWALESLQKARMRVSRIKELNDPFEWRVGSKANNPRDQEFVRKTLVRRFLSCCVFKTGKSEVAG